MGNKCPRMMKKWTIRYTMSPLGASLFPCYFHFPPPSPRPPSIGSSLPLCTPPPVSFDFPSLLPPCPTTPTHPLSTITRLSTTLRSYTVVVLSVCCIFYVTSLVCTAYIIAITVTLIACSARTPPLSHPLSIVTLSSAVRLLFSHTLTHIRSHLYTRRLPLISRPV